MDYNWIAMVKKTTIVIPAIGKKYFDLASGMKKSAAKWGWKADIIIVSDLNGKTKFVQNGGREVKQNFVNFIPENHAGPCVMLDADMVAIGDEPDWEAYDKISTCANHRTDVPITFSKKYAPLSGYLSDGMIVICPTRDHAIGLCKRWGAIQDFSNPKSEHWALWEIQNDTEFNLLDSPIEPIKGKLKHLQYSIYENIHQTNRL